MKRHGDFTETRSVKPCIEEDSFLQRLISPMSIQDFKKNCFRNSPAKFSCNSERLEFIQDELIEPYMSELDVPSIVERSASTDIFVWMLGPDGKIGSFGASREVAMTCYRAGLSLYFRSCQEMADEFVGRLVRELGVIGSHWSDGNVKSEVEVFISKAGHKTDWHFDFQENWTVQLQGTKRWRFRNNPNLKSPLRGCTPHYDGEDAGVVEKQAKSHELCSPGWKKDNCEEEFVLEVGPGDVLYHPAGVWHRVEVVGEEESVSVNISIVGSSWAEIVGQAVTTMLWRNPEFRATACDMGTGSDALEMLRQVSGKLKTAHLIPPSTSTCTRVISSIVMDPADPTLTLSVNPCATMVRVGEYMGVEAIEEDMEQLVDEEDQEEEEDELEEPTGVLVYSVNCNFGNSELESFYRVLIKCPAEAHDLVEHLRTQAIFEPFKCSELTHLAESSITLQTISALLSSGFLIEE